MAEMITYKGGAKDHAAVPLLLDEEGQVKQEGSTKFHAIDLYNLQGVELPKGKAVKVEDEAVIAKARSLNASAAKHGKPALFDIREVKGEKAVDVEAK